MINYRLVDAIFKNINGNEVAHCFEQNAFYALYKMIRYSRKVQYCFAELMDRRLMSCICNFIPKMSMETRSSHFLKDLLRLIEMILDRGQRGSEYRDYVQWFIDSDGIKHLNALIVNAAHSNVISDENVNKINKILTKCANENNM